VSWKTWLARLVMVRLSRQETLVLACDVLTGWLAGLFGGKKVAFLRAPVREPGSGAGRVKPGRARVSWVISALERS